MQRHQYNNESLIDLASNAFDAFQEHDIEYLTGIAASMVAAGCTISYLAIKDLLKNVHNKTEFIENIQKTANIKTT
jgi:basic membrane lipoprotein Med (substrate-binding protein (PBP1-ABC) superfamily)